MAPRPRLWLGDFLRTIDHRSIRCKRYDEPPYSGRYIDTLDPGTTLGPVTRVLHTPTFMTVEADGKWINVWGTAARADPMEREARGTLYANRTAPPTGPSDSGLWGRDGHPIPQPAVAGSATEASGAVTGNTQETQPAPDPDPDPTQPAVAG